MSEREAPTVLTLADAATAFAMELAQPGVGGRDRFGLLDRATALSALSTLAGHRPEVLLRTRRTLDDGAPGADELLATAALWASFTGDD
jgi:hypothetical protein